MATIGVGWMEDGGGGRQGGSIKSLAECRVCHHDDCNHTNTLSTIAGALMDLSLTWEKRNEGEIERAKWREGHVTVKVFRQR